MDKDVGPSSVEMPESATVPSALKGNASEMQRRDKTAMDGASILASFSNQLNKEDNNSNRSICNQNDGGGGENNREGMEEEDDNECNNVISFNDADSRAAVINTGTKGKHSIPDLHGDQTVRHMEFRYCYFEY
jgi:hypothetical protein